MYMRSLKCPVCGAAWFTGLRVDVNEDRYLLFKLPLKSNNAKKGAAGGGRGRRLEEFEYSLTAVAHVYGDIRLHISPTYI